MLSFLIVHASDLLSERGQVILTGLLELANGCCELEKIANDGLRFMAAAVMLSFGGLCVAMQTLSVTEKLGLGSYLPGKLLQTLISLMLAFGVQAIFLGGEASPAWAAVGPALLGLVAIILRESEKRCSIPARIGV